MEDMTRYHLNESLCVLDQEISLFFFLIFFLPLLAFVLARTCKAIEGHGVFHK